MQESCAQFNGAPPNNSEDEINEIKTAVQSVASSTGVDPRFIFAILMQESNGCVRAPTTNYGVRNPGLMQSHNGAGSCNDGNIQNPCPQSEVTQMIQDGTAGTNNDPYGGSGGGDGLVQLLAKQTATDVSRYYNAARLYNSGSLSASGNEDTNAATPCYVSDIANRLVGWSSGASSCTSGKVAELDASAGSAHASSGDAGTPDTPVQAAPSPVVTNTVVPLPATTAAAAPAAASTHASTPSAPITPSTSTAQKYPGAVSACTSYYTVVAGDYCDLVTSKTGVSFATLRNLNPGLDAVCSNLWLGYQYCIQS